MAKPSKTPRKGPTKTGNKDPKSGAKSRPRKDIPKDIRNKLLVDAMHRCCLCPAHEDITDLHHIDPISEGGPDTEDNLMAVCPTCHAKIHRLRKKYTPEQLRTYKQRWVRLCALGLPLDMRLAMALDHTNPPPAPQPSVTSEPAPTPEPPRQATVAPPSPNAGTKTPEPAHYDVFISYSHHDRDWVRGWLLPRLEQAGLRVCIDFRDFAIGVPSLVNMERAVEQSDKTFLVLTPSWLKSQWTNFEALMLQTDDPIGLQRRVIPLKLAECELPRRLAIFTYADFTHPEDREAELQRVLRQISAAPERSDRTEPPQISTAKLPSTPPELFGREVQLEQLNLAWADPNTNIVAVVAFGGVGKTALVNRWIRDLRDDHWRGAERVFGWSFYSQGAAEDRQQSADPFIANALRFFGDPAPDAGLPWQKGERLAGYVKKQRTLLVLDGLEPLQFPPPTQPARLKDPGMQALLRELALDNPGLCVVSTRIVVDDLKDFTGSTVRQMDLEDLDPAAGAHLLANLGVLGSPTELEQASRDFAGHALALTLLGRYLAIAYQGDVRQRDKVPRLTDEPRQGGHARRVIGCYERWFADQPELNILRIVGLFDRPAEQAAIAAVRGDPPIAGLTSDLAALSPDQWQFALRNLRDARLLREPDDFAPDALDAHPIVREHFRDQLRAQHPDAWREAHNRLYEHYKNTAKPLPDTIEDMTPLYAAVIHGCHAGRHQEALHKVYQARIQRGDEAFNTHKLGAFGAELACLSGFFDSPWSRPAKQLSPPATAYVLSEAGFDLRALGRLTEALQPMQAALEMAVAREDWRNAGAAACNLSDLHVALGNLSQALECAQRSVEYADRSGDAFQRLSKRATLAGALHQFGRMGDAQTAFEQAEAIQKDDQPEYQILYSLQGFRYCDLLLDQGREEDVRDRAARTLDWASQYLGLLDIGLDHLSLGRALLLQACQRSEAVSQEATDHLDQAVGFLRRAGQQDYLARGLLARAALHRVCRQFAPARRDLDQAMTIAARGRMRRHEADAHLECARLHLAQRQPEPAREHLATAEKMINEMAYHRRDPELALARARLALLDADQPAARRHLENAGRLIETMGCHIHDPDANQLQSDLDS